MTATQRHALRHDVSPTSRHRVCDAVRGALRAGERAYRVAGIVVAKTSAQESSRSTAGAAVAEQGS